MQHSLTTLKPFAAMHVRSFRPALQGFMMDYERRFATSASTTTKSASFSAVKKPPSPSSDPTKPEPKRLLVKAEVKNFGHLAGTILADVKHPRGVALDAIGDVAIANSVKAVGLANALIIKAAEQESADDYQLLGFLPEMISEEEGVSASGSEVKHSVRLAVSPRIAMTRSEDWDRGGLFVASKDSAATSPSEIARMVLEEWIRFAAPDEQQADRALSRQRNVSGQMFKADVLIDRVCEQLQGTLHALQDLSAHLASKPGKASKERSQSASSRQAATSQSSSSSQRRPRSGANGREPFLLPMDASAMSRSIKGLAFAIADLKKPYLSAVPSFLVVPRFWERKATDRYSSREKVSKVTVLCLKRALS